MKRIATTLLATLMLLSCCFSAGASVARASIYLTYCGATTQAGTRSGTIEITYDVRASVRASTIGVSKIEIYKSNGTRVTTINGSASNGLLLSNEIRHRSSYTYKGVSGTAYYAKVTMTAKDASGSDSKTVTTSTVTAP